MYQGAKMSRLNNARELAFISARVGGELAGAAATAANFELGRERFLVAASNAYDGMATLFAEADARDAARSKQMRDIFNNLPDPELDRAFEEMKVDEEENRGPTTEEDAISELNDNEVWRLNYGVAWVEHVDRATNEVDLVWLTGRYSNVDELRRDHTIVDYFRGGELVAKSLRDYQVEARPQIKRGNVWRINETTVLGPLPFDGARLVVTEEGQARIRFRWIQGGYADDLEVRDDSASPDFFYAHAILEKNLPDPGPDMVWNNGNFIGFKNDRNRMAD
jgi:hypothetical protein